MKPRVIFRLYVLDPLPGVTYALQRGQAELLAPRRSTPTELVFEFPLTVADVGAEPPRLTGEYAQGPPKERFVYMNSGSMAGQRSSCWKRRAKVPLNGVERSSLEEVTEDRGKVLEARILGTSPDGGPACATVPLLSPWVVANDA